MPTDPRRTRKAPVGQMLLNLCHGAQEGGVCARSIGLDDDPAPVGEPNAEHRRNRQLEELEFVDRRAELPFGECSEAVADRGRFVRAEQRAGERAIRVVGDGLSQLVSERFVAHAARLPAC